MANWIIDLAKDIGAVVAVPYTAGASLALSPTAQKLLRGIIKDANYDDASGVDARLKEWELKNEQWKKEQEFKQQEVERLRKEREENDKKIKNNNDEIARTTAIINNPNSSEEERKNAKRRIVLLETEIKDIKAKNKKIEEDIKENSKPTPPPSKPWIFPKLGITSKIIIAGSAILLVYLVIDDKKKEKPRINPKKA